MDGIFTIFFWRSYEKHQFIGYGDDNDKFAFIVVPGLRNENVPGYKLIQSDKGDIFILYYNVVNL